MKEKSLTILSIGDTGAGKSSFCNLYLKGNFFKVSNSTDPVTTDPVVQYQDIGPYRRYAIDTEGLNDGHTINSVQIQKLADLLKEYEHGVNAVCIVLNGQQDRFSQGSKDLIKFAYDSFPDKSVLTHMCIVFTKCYIKYPNNPNRNTKRTIYRQRVMEYLRKISKVNDIPEIKIFFVDCKDGSNPETTENMNQFIEWASSLPPLSTKDYIAAHFREDIEIEKRSESTGFVIQGNTKYENIEDQMRHKFIPNNGDPVRYDNWVTLKVNKIPVERWRFERKENVELGCVDEDDVRYQMYINQERKIVTDLKTNKDDVGFWYNVGDIKKVEIARRKRRMVEVDVKEDEKVVEHHNAHSLAGFSSHDHTHYEIYRNTWKEKYEEVTDFDGTVTQGERSIVPGSASRSLIYEGREKGFTQGYKYVVT